jgi:putative endonuclease
VKRQRAEAKGRHAERLAAWWLRLHGWRIVAQRQRVASGEVDLVARRAGTLAFIEVKWRSRATDLDLAIDSWRLRRVVAAARALAPRLARPHENIRIDVMLLAPWRLPHHLTNVWQE